MENNRKSTKRNSDELVKMSSKRQKERKIVDDIDLKLLYHLSKNANESIKEIAKKIGIPVSTAFARIKKLEEKGIIKSYTIKINPIALGFAVTAIIHFSVEGPYLEEIEKQIALNPNIIALYDTTGDFDIIAIARFQSINELDKFIKNTLKNPKVKRTITNVVLRVVKEDYPGIPIVEESVR